MARRQGGCRRYTSNGAWTQGQKCRAVANSSSNIRQTPGTQDSGRTWLGTSVVQRDIPPRPVGSHEWQALDGRGLKLF